MYSKFKLIPAIGSQTFIKSNIGFIGNDKVMCGINDCRLNSNSGYSSVEQVIRAASTFPYQDRGKENSAFSESVQTVAPVSYWFFS